MFHSDLEQLEKLNSFQVYNIMGKWASSSLSGIDSRGSDSSSLSGIDSRGSDSSRSTTSHVSGWAWLLPTLLAFPSTAFRHQGLFLDLVLDLCLSQSLSQRTFLSKGLVLHVLDVLLVSTLREHLFLYVHLQERTPDHHLRHPRREGFPTARFCFACVLCAANFKPTITWKQNGTAIVVGDHSSVVKWFLFIVKNNSMRSFMRNLVAMRQMKTKLRCLKPHRPYTVDFAIDAR